MKQRFFTKNKKEVLLATAILLLGMFFRFLNLNWDQNQHLHPDERFLTMVGVKIKWPKNISQYPDTQKSPLNPYNQGFRFFVYGTLPLFLTKLVASFWQKNYYGQFNLVGRGISALFDLSTIILIGIISKKMIKKNWFWPMFIYAVSVLPIQLAHFFAVDTFLNFFLTASFLFLLLFNRKKSSFFLVSAGASLGLALACKITAVLFIPFALTFISYLSLKEKKKKWLFFQRNALFLFFSFIFFRFFQPYAFVNLWQPNPQFIANLKELKNLNHPDSLFPPAIQWIKTKPLIFPGKNILFWGLGVPLGIVTFVSFLLFPIHFLKKKKKPPFLFLIYSFSLFLFFYHGSQFVKAMRYFLPLYPWLSLITGNTIACFLKKIKEKKHRLLISLSLIFLFLVWPLSFISIYLHPHSRVQASDWIYQHVPPGSTLSCEHWDDCLPLPLEKKNPRQYHYQTEMLHLYNRETKRKWQKINNQLQRVDYLILSSNRLWGPIPQNPEIYPQTAKFYQDLFAGKLNFQKVAEITSYPCFPPLSKPLICFPDQSAEEAFTVYDHPKVIIFKKSRQKSPQLSTARSFYLFLNKKKRQE